MASLFLNLDCHDSLILCMIRHVRPAFSQTFFHSSVRTGPHLQLADGQHDIANGKSSRGVCRRVATGLLASKHILLL